MTQTSVKKILACCSIAMSTSAMCADYGGYTGKGGMSAYKIEANVYEYHYDKGFTGPDAMGWDLNAQYAWSRIAAAKLCGAAEASNEKLIPLLMKSFGQDKLVHEMIGIGFHEAQIKANPKFCTPERVSEIRDVFQDFNAGNFPKKF